MNFLYLHFERQVSTSSFSENVSINNDSVTPQSPLTPPPSPLSPTDSNDKTTESEENGTEISVKIGIDGDNLTESNQSETETETETTPVDTMPNVYNSILIFLMIDFLI